MENFLKDKDVLKSCSLLILFIVVALVLYYPTLHSAPLWDDWVFIFKSWTLQHTSPREFWVWGSHRRSWPLFYTLISLMHKFWGVKVFNYHLVSLLLHAVNSLLIYKLLKKIGGTYQLLITVLFLVHPLQFFNVVWIIQIKTLLSIFFFLIAFLLFLDNEKSNSKLTYVLSVFSFALSLFSKASFAPMILLFLFYKNKIKMLPFIFLCLYSVGLTLWSTHIKSSVKSAAVIQNIFVSNVYAQTGSTELFLKRKRPSQVIMIKNTESQTTAQLALNNLSRYVMYIVAPLKTVIVQPSTPVTLSYQELFLASATVLFLVWLFLQYFFEKKFIPLAGLAFFLITLVPLCGMAFIPIFHYSNFVEYWLSVPVLGVLICLSFSQFKFKNYVLTFFILFFGFKTLMLAKETPEPVSMINAAIEMSPKRPLVKLILASHYFYLGDYAKSNQILLNVKKTSNMDKNFLDKQIEKNMKGLKGEKVDDYTL